MSAQITTQRIQAMVTDWLRTPVNGYLGSSYGQDLKRILHNPLTSPLADWQVAKLRKDVPALGMLPEGAVNIYTTHDQRDQLKLFVELAGQLIPVDDASSIRVGDDATRNTN